MNRNATRVCLLLIWIAAWQSSCGTGRQSGCEKHIKEEIPAGMPSEMAVTALKKCGFKTAMDSAKNTLHGEKLVKGTPISERTQVLVDLDSDKKVVTVKVTKGFIGP
jgi:hypothetical protein